MAVNRGMLLLAVIVLSFISALLLADFATPGGSKIGESIASFFSFPSVEHSDAEKCECEYSSALGDYICNTFCGDLSGTSCLEKADCII